ncbi:MAG: hypothetical protein AB7O24_07960 [Kofleriaceae bacterium]
MTCPEKRRRVLRSVELHGRWRPMCFNCAGQLLTLNPVPETIEEMTLAISRERRRVDRRAGKPDTRVFRYERRVGERRMPRDVIRPIDDEMIIEITIDDDGMPVPALTADLAPDVDVIIAMPVDGAAETAPAPVSSSTPSDPGAFEEIDFDDLTAIRDLVQDLRPSDLAIETQRAS